MSDTQAIDLKKQVISVNDYATYLKNCGNRVIAGGERTCWASYERGTMMRIPIFYIGSPASNELQQVFWQGRVAIASYLLEPDDNHPANAWLYICTDQEYSLDKLAPPMRRNVRRGLKELTIAPLTLEQILAQGAQAFYDTRNRAGLSDGTFQTFYQRVTHHAGLDTGVFLGAWKENELAAFLAITEVDDWAELNCYSADALLQYRPNDTLMYSALSHYLTKRNFCLVSYGLSSIQAESNAVGLHKFKIKVGFEARRVHRAFIPHPLLRPFANRLTLHGINMLLQLRPQDRRLKKAGGMLEYMLGGTHMPQSEEENTDDTPSS